MNIGDFSLDGYTMGLGRPVVVESFEPPTLDYATGDVVDAWGRRHFGRDYALGGTATLLFATDTATADEARLAYGDLVRAWAAAREVGEAVALRYRLGTEERFVYGRPRKLAPTVDGLHETGQITAVGEFVLESAVSYGLEARSVTVPLIPAATGGFAAPFTAPLSTEGIGRVTGAIDDVGGDVPAPITVVFHGPLTNPTLEGDGWTLALAYSLIPGERVTIDTRTFSAVSSRGPSVAGAISLSTRLSVIRLSPGPDYVRLTGTDPTGTGRAVVTWRPAYLGI